MQKKDMSLLSSSSFDADQSVEAISSAFNRQMNLKPDNDQDVDSKFSQEVHVDDEEHDQSVEAISRAFNRQIDLKPDNDQDVDSKFSPDDDDNEDVDDNFTFMLVGDDESPIDGEIQPAFPLFDQKLLRGGDYEVEEISRLPIQPPVDKIFIQSPVHEQIHDATSGPYCVWSKKPDNVTAELSKKSNSTGFSKLWRLKEKGGRSNSYGRDAFVFFKNSDRKATTSKGYLAEDVKARGVKKAAKKSTVSSAHEAYLKSKEEERKRSYLPYRPELMGFFTNVHGGLTKNVHPY